VNRGLLLIISKESTGNNSLRIPLSKESKGLSLERLIHVDTAKIPTLYMQGWVHS
jgi:hypothetical protein